METKSSLGLEGGRTGSYFYKTGSSGAADGGGHAAVWLYVGLLNCTLRNGQDGKFHILCAVQSF